MNYFEHLFTFFKVMMTYAPRVRMWGNADLLMLMTENYYKHEIDGEHALQVPLCHQGHWRHSLWYDNHRSLRRLLEVQPAQDYLKLTFDDYLCKLLIKPMRLSALQIHESNLMPLQWSIWNARPALEIVDGIFATWMEEESDLYLKRIGKATTERTLAIIR